MIYKGYIYHLAEVKDFIYETTIIELVPVVNKFPEVFQKNIPRVPLERDIDFEIDLLPDTQTISIPPY